MTPDRVQWERYATALSGKLSAPVLVSELGERSAFVLLAEPGMGKSDVLGCLAGALPESLRLVADLGDYDERRLRRLFEEKLPARLSALPGGAQLHLFLDSVDEARIDIDGLVKTLGGYLDELDGSSVRVRIACRTLDWPHASLDGLLRRRWGLDQDEPLLWRLEDLRESDIALAARERLGAAAPAFLEAAARDARIAPIISRPITLFLLLRLWETNGTLPSTAREIFEQATVRLFSDHNRWLNLGDHEDSLTASERRDVGGMIAGAGLLTGRVALLQGERPGPAYALDLDDLVGRRVSSRGLQLEVTRRVLNEVLLRGPFAPRRPGEIFTWTHRTIAEFLAARWLGRSSASDEQIQALLVQRDMVGKNELRVIPQLAEVVAWIAPERPHLFGRLARLDPVALLRADVRSVADGPREALVDALLCRANEGQIVDDFELERYLPGLAHPSLGEQLGKWISDEGADWQARRLAVRVAAACQLDGLDQELAGVLHEETETNLPAVAARALVASWRRAGRWDDLRALLRQVETGEVPDPEDEVRGSVLSALYPARMSLTDILPHLEAPRRRNFYGGYRSFISAALRESELDSQEVLVLWRWFLQDGLEKLRQGASEVREIVQQVAQKLDERHVAVQVVRDLGAERRRLVGSSVGRGIAAAIAERPEARACLVEALVSEWAAINRAGPSLLWELGLAAERDHFLSLLGRPELLDSERTAILAMLPYVVGDYADADNWAPFFRAAKHHPGVESWLNRLMQEHGARGPAGLAEAFRLAREAEDADASRQVLDPPPAERVRIRLEQALASDLAAYPDLIYQLTLDDSDVRGNHVPVSIVETVGWQRADESTRERILDASERWLREGDPATDEWIGSNRVHFGATAGVLALTLLEARDPSRLDAFEAGLWARWAAAMLLNWSPDGDADSVGARVLARFVSQAPGALADALRRDLTAERSNEWLPIRVRTARLAWCSDVYEALAEMLQDSAVGDNAVQAIAEVFLQQGIEVAGTLRSWCTGGTSSQRIAALASALLQNQPEEHWDLLEATAFGVPEVRERVLLRSSRGAFAHEGLAAKIEDPRIVGRLAGHLIETFPPLEDPPDSPSGFISERTSAAHLRDGTLRRLVRIGTWDAVRAIEELRQRFPDDKLGLRWRSATAAASARALSWVPRKLDTLFDVLAGRSTVYLSARFGTQLRERLRLVLENRYNVVVTEAQARDGATEEVIREDMAGASVLVQAVDWSHGLGDRDAPGGSWLEREWIVARVTSMSRLLGVLEDADSAPSDVEAYLAGLRQETTWVASQDRDKLVERLVESVERLLQESSDRHE